MLPITLRPRHSCHLGFRQRNYGCRLLETLKETSGLLTTLQTRCAPSNHGETPNSSPLTGRTTGCERSAERTEIGRRTSGIQGCTGSVTFASPARIGSIRRCERACVSRQGQQRYRQATVVIGLPKQARGRVQRARRAQPIRTTSVTVPAERAAPGDQRGPPQRVLGDRARQRSRGVNGAGLGADNGRIESVEGGCRIGPDTPQGRRRPPADPRCRERRGPRRAGAPRSTADGGAKMPPTMTK